jgi:tetratricopeptide (TPR) repeat protein
MNVKEYKERALKYFDEGNYDRAIADLNEVIRLEPDNHSAYFMRGGAYIYKENITLAISDLEMAVKIDPQNKEYREALVEIKHQFNM